MRLGDLDVGWHCSADDHDARRIVDVPDQGFRKQASVIDRDGLGILRIETDSDAAVADGRRMGRIAAYPDLDVELVGSRRRTALQGPERRPIGPRQAV
jgi:hypothetical protein